MPARPPTPPSAPPASPAPTPGSALYEALRLLLDDNLDKVERIEAMDALEARESLLRELDALTLDREDRADSVDREDRALLELLELFKLSAEPELHALSIVRGGLGLLPPVVSEGSALSGASGTGRLGPSSSSKIITFAAGGSGFAPTKATSSKLDSEAPGLMPIMDRPPCGGVNPGLRRMLPMTMIGDHVRLVDGPWRLD